MKTIVVTLLSTLFFCSQIFAETETYEINNASGSETDFVYNKYQRYDNSKIIISERKGTNLSYERIPTNVGGRNKIENHHYTTVMMVAGRILRWVLKLIGETLRRSRYFA